MEINRVSEAPESAIENGRLEAPEDGGAGAGEAGETGSDDDESGPRDYPARSGATMAASGGIRNRA